MPSILNMMKVRSERRRSSNGHDDGQIIDIPKSVHTSKQSAQLQSTRSISQSAACRGLYATPKRREGQSKSHSAHSRVSYGVEEGDNLSDPILKCSIYPQAISQRRPELKTASTQPTDTDREVCQTQRNEDIAGTGRRKRRQQTSSYEPVCSPKANSTFSSGSSSAAGREDRAARVSVHSQAQYGNEGTRNLTKTPRTSCTSSRSFSSEDSSASAAQSRTFKRSSLPGDEYQMLVRRQKMQRARDLLATHFAGRGTTRGEHIQHGMMQTFTIRSPERCRTSKMQFAVRKALRAGLNLLDDDSTLALNRHSDKVHFSELSDVDGVPVDKHAMFEFICMYHEAQDAAAVAQSPGVRCGEPVQRAWIDKCNDRIRQTDIALEREDSVGIADAPSMTKPHLLVSKLSWDSNDGNVGMRKRLTRPKR